MNLYFLLKNIMYVPTNFKVDDPAVIRSFVEKNAFGLVLTIHGDEIHDTHTPFVYSVDGNHLIGHMAKNNPQWKSWNVRAKSKVIFTGAHSYISPKYYLSEFAVPTWNYTAVSITGCVTIVEKQDEVLQFFDRLIVKNESSNGPWTLDRNDARYMNLLSGIIVFSISIDSVEASFKLSQNRSEEDQRKVIGSLFETGCPFDRDVANMMSQNINDAE